MGPIPTAAPDRDHAAATNFLASFSEAIGRPAPEVVFQGDERLPSAFAVTDFAAASIANAGVAARRVSEQAGAPSSEARVVADLRFASIWFGTTVRAQGWELPALWDPIAGNYLAGDRFVRLHTNAPAHRKAALEVLGCAPTADRNDVTAAVASWDAFDLHEAVVNAGGVAAALRSPDEWAAHEQGRAIAAEPLVQRTIHPPQAEPIGGTAADGRAPHTRPLEGVRVLDLTRVLAGPVSTRFLAGLGADVLRIDPPTWNEPGTVPEVNLGKRAARLDLLAESDRAKFERLLASADILVHGYRLGALDQLGFDEDRRRELNPGLVDVSLNAYGHTGPWAVRRGFDSVVQVACGIASTGMQAFATEVPKPLPMQALDHATGYTLAASALEGWHERIASGRGSTWKTSLAAHAELLMSGPVGDPTKISFAMEPNDEQPALETTSWGPAHRALPPLSMPYLELSWERGACDHGSHSAAWLVNEPSR